MPTYVPSGLEPMDAAGYNSYSVDGLPANGDTFAVAGRLQALRSYSLANVRDTWVSMGQTEVTNTTRIYNRNSIMMVTQPLIALTGCIIYCAEDYQVIPTFDWTNIRLNDPLNNVGNYLIDVTTNIIDANLYCVCTKAQYDAIVEPYDPAFLPYQTQNSTSILNISDDDLNQILIEIGVPFIALEELEYTRDQIINLMVWPAVKEYFKYFPIHTVGKYPLADTNFNIPLPPAPVFTAISAHVSAGYPISNTTGNPITRYFDEVLMSISPRGAFSTPNLNSSRRQGFVDTQSYGTYILERSARAGIINNGTKRRTRFYVEAGYVKGYTTQRGALEITWGSYSTNWSDILMTRQREVRDLAKANVLRAMYMLRMQAKSDLPGTLNFDSFLARAQELEDRTLALWVSIVKSPIIRAS